jgi:hypothetical protein
VLLIDAANVIGSRPNGWWRDRPGAARTFVDKVRLACASGNLAEPVVVVLEGDARRGVEEGIDHSVKVVHAVGSGDDMLIDIISDVPDQVTLVTADRGLRERADALGAEVVGPKWLVQQLEE